MQDLPMTDQLLQAFGSQLTTRFVVRNNHNHKVDHLHAERPWFTVKK